MKERIALITGITGQDGSYLAEALLQEGFKVHAVIRRETLEAGGQRLANIRHLLDKIILHVGAIDNHLSIYKIIAQVKPDECYHLAASSFVSYSFDDEASVFTSNFNSTHYLLASIKELVPACRFYFAGSSEMFGNADMSPQNEQSRFNPRSIYGISKLSAYQLVRNYREQYGIFACAGILYNHESPRRGFEFVTRKISSTVAKIHLGHAQNIELGNIEAQRDWGYAPEYVHAMRAMLAQDAPDDYVIATGRLHSVKNFLQLAFDVVGLDYRNYVHVNSDYFRPTETVPLCGDASKAKRRLGWSPQKRLEQIVEEMVLADIRRLEGLQ